MILRYFLLLIVMIMAHSCNTVQGVVSQNETAVFAGAFIIHTLYDQPIKGTDLNLKIDDRTSAISGLSGCNTYNVDYTIQNNTLTFSDVISTKRFCNGDAMKKEREFLNIFATTKEYRIDEDTLILYDKGTEVLKATRFIF